MILQTGIEFGSIEYKSIYWDDFGFPRIGCVYARTLAQDLVSVQHMSEPTGVVNWNITGTGEGRVFSIPVGDIPEADIAEANIEEYIQRITNRFQRQINFDNENLMYDQTPPPEDYYL